MNREARQERQGKSFFLAVLAVRKNAESDRVQYSASVDLPALEDILTSQEASPIRRLNICQPHQGLETCLHFRLGVTLREDASRTTTVDTGKVMALIKQVKFYNAFQAGRWVVAQVLDLPSQTYILGNFTEICGIIYFYRSEA